jgi:tight adherence protein B
VAGGYKMKRNKSFKNELFKTIAVFSSTLFAVFLVCRSLMLASIFASLASTAAFLHIRKNRNKRTVAITSAWPEVIDHLISGIQSGLSISETLIALSWRGPTVLREYFTEFGDSLKIDGDFNTALRHLKDRCGQHGSDQIFEAIAISKSLGGNELLNILRTVGTFLRQDLALRREIEVKHGWIKNSAHLSAAAPWLLLLLLSSQPSTAHAFSTPTGILILMAGMAMTAIAYIWMDRLGRLPELPRVFGGA